MLEEKLKSSSPALLVMKENLQSIVKETGNKNVVFKLLDLGSFKSARSFVSDILNAEGRLDILINNAGVGIVNRNTVSMA